MVVLCDDGVVCDGAVCDSAVHGSAMHHGVACGDAVHNTTITQHHISHSTSTQSTIMHSSETVCGMVCRWSAGVNTAADGAVRRRSATTAVAKGEGAGAGATDCQKGRAAAEASDPLLLWFVLPLHSHAQSPEGRF